ncbi:MAG: two-component regulator propeller domain-containing protein, partial [Bacteroidota bacterium]
MLVGVVSLRAQRVAPHFRQFTTEDGLPSTETYFVLEDRAGYLWFGTDNGVARFDGYSFQVFDSDDGLDDVVTFRLIEGPDGRIWASTYSGRIFYFEGGRFHAWEHNRKISLIQKNYRTVLLSAISEDEVFYFKNYRNALQKIDHRGTIDKKLVHLLKEIFLYPGHKENTDLSLDQQLSQTETSRDGAIPAKQLVFKSINKDGSINDFTLEASTNLDGVNIIHIAQPNPNFQQAIFLFCEDSLRLLENWETKAILPLRSDQVNYIFPHQQAGFWLCKGSGEGLHYLPSNDHQGLSIDTCLANHSISYGTYDSRGGLWITSLDGGVFYASHPENVVFDATLGLPRTKALSVSTTGDRGFFAVGVTSKET